ncbi:MAG TPA: hypothetical protein PLA90_08855 [Candidatus Sumerlaeota bacterium]|nr:hypothetical protein [Candidatus Sumerlaeota bacterium]HPS01639.1 hypothetical protein [Candidatus Sumerlaeota bacterium]
MAGKRGITTREKVIVTLTGFVILGCLIYQMFLADFLDEYNTTVEAIASAQEALADYRDTMNEGSQVDAEYEESGQSVLQKVGDKNVGASFTEELNKIFGKTISLQRPEAVAIPRATDFAFLEIDAKGLRAPLSDLADILREFYKRNILVQSLRIELTGSAIKAPQLDFEATVARIVRADELDKPDLERLKKLQEAQKKSSSKKTTESKSSKKAEEE